MFTWNLWALQATWKLGFRYRGMVKNRQAYGFTPNTVHQSCCTRLRVGIDNAGNSFIFCWRCEQILGSSSGPVKTPLQLSYDKVVASAKTERLAVSEKQNIIMMANHKKPTPPTAS